MSIRAGAGGSNPWLLHYASHTNLNHSGPQAHGMGPHGYHSYNQHEPRWRPMMLSKHPSLITTHGFYSGPGVSAYPSLDMERFPHAMTEWSESPIFYQSGCGPGSLGFLTAASSCSCLQSSLPFTQHTHMPHPLESGCHPHLGAVSTVDLRHQPQHRSSRPHQRLSRRQPRHHTLTDESSAEWKRKAQAYRCASLNARSATLLPKDHGSSLNSGGDSSDNNGSGSSSGDSGIQTGSSSSHQQLSRSSSRTLPHLPSPKLRSHGSTSSSSSSLASGFPFRSKRVLPNAPAEEISPPQKPVAKTRNGLPEISPASRTGHKSIRLMSSWLKTVKLSKTKDKEPRLSGDKDDSSLSSHSRTVPKKLAKSRSSHPSTSKSHQVVFGRALDGTSNLVPEVLLICTCFIEKEGITDGIYRISGISSNIKKLRLLFDEALQPHDLCEQDWILQDVHSVSSVLKLFFRELPESLIPSQAYPMLKQAQSIETLNSDSRAPIGAYQKALALLTKGHFRILGFLMHHLKRVSAQSEITGMTAKNLAIVWAPNLIPAQESDFLAATDMLSISSRGPEANPSAQAKLQLNLVQNTQIVTFLIENASSLFENQDMDGSSLLQQHQRARERRLMKRSAARRNTLADGHRATMLQAQVGAPERAHPRVARHPQGPREPPRSGSPGRNHLEQRQPNPPGATSTCVSSRGGLLSRPLSGTNLNYKRLSLSALHHGDQQALDQVELPDENRTNSLKIGAIPAEPKREGNSLSSRYFREKEKRKALTQQKQEQKPNASPPMASQNRSQINVPDLLANQIEPNLSTSTIAINSTSLPPLDQQPDLLQLHNCSPNQHQSHGLVRVNNNEVSSPLIISRPLTNIQTQGHLPTHDDGLRKHREHLRLSRASDQSGSEVQGPRVVFDESRNSVADEILSPNVIYTSRL